MLSRLAIVFVCSGALVACSSADTTSSPSEPVASESSDITTTDVISRAAQWVNAKLLYCQSPNHQHDYDTACSSTCNRQDNTAWDPYRSDCSGFVSWAWGLPAPGRVTSQFAPADNSVSHAINAIDLQPGDACNYPSDHIILFVKWITKGSSAEFYEEPGCSSSTPYAHSFTSNVTISGSSIHVAYEGMTFTAIRYDNIQPPNAPPTGSLDTASCDTIAGWAQDPDAPASALTVDLTFDAPTGKAGSGSLKRTANVYRSDLCKPLGSCNHGFSLDMPLGLQDGAKHSVYAYGTDTADSTLALLTSAPKSFTCAPPAIPNGTKRHVTSTTAMKAWQLDPLLDVAKEPLAAVQALPTGPDLPATPTVVISDDGSPEVWVVDTTKESTQVRRHVVNPASLAAWQLAATKWTAAKVNAIPQGLDWPLAPFALQGTGAPEVYVMDEMPASPGADGGAPSKNDGGSGDSFGGGSGGCSTSGGGSGDAWAIGLAALLIAKRKKR